MLRKLLKFVGGVLLLVAFGSPALAEGPQFQLIYRQENLTVSGDKASADVLINVFNGTGEDVTELSVAIPGENSILFHTLPVEIGDIPNGHQKEIIKEILIPADFLQRDNVKGNVMWQIYYTTPAGERKSTAVAGKKGL